MLLSQHLLYLHLQRHHFQVRSRSWLPGEHELLGNTIQPTIVTNSTQLGRHMLQQVEIEVKGVPDRKKSIN